MGSNNMDDIYLAVMTFKWQLATGVYLARSQSPSLVRRGTYFVIPYCYRVYLWMYSYIQILLAATWYVQGIVFSLSGLDH